MNADTAAFGRGKQHPPKGRGGPPLVLLHGFLGSPGAWDAVLAALPSHGTVWCPWLPGHGVDGAARVLPPNWDAAVEALMAALPAGAVLAGYSMGARLALDAALHRGRPALLVGGHVGLATTAERAERAALDTERAAALRQGPLADFVDAWQALPLFASQHELPAEARARQRAARLDHDALALAWAFEVGSLARMPDLRPALATATAPIVFVTGMRDPKFDALAAGLARPPAITHHRVAGAGHNLLLEAPAAVAASLACLLETP